MTYIDHVVELIRSEQSLSSYATAHQLDEERLRETREAFLAGATAARAPRPRRVVWAVLVALVAVAALTPAAVRASGRCSRTLPGLLLPFCDNAPAIASEINGNFAELARYIEGRTGPMNNTGLADLRQPPGGALRVTDNSFDLEATSLEMNSGNNGGTALSLSGDSLVVGSPNLTGVSFGAPITGVLSAASAGFTGNVNFAGGATFPVTPQLQAGLAMNGCYDRYSTYGNANEFHWATCNNGDYIRAVACRANGTGGTQCLVSCCHP